MDQNFNLHTHTYRCQHAEGDIDDYCKFANKLGLQSLGFSDHTPLPDNRWPNVRMKLSELEDYCKKIDEAKEKYPNMRIYKGMECEYDQSYCSFYKEELLGKYELDYLIGSVHWFPYNSKWINAWRSEAKPKYLLAYSQYIIKIMEAEIFKFIAHPDVFAAFYLEEDKNSLACAKDILSAAEALQIPLEINGYGFMKKEVKTGNGFRKMYPWHPFWQLASEYKIKAIVNSDAHKPTDVYGCIDDALKLAETYNLDVIDDPNLLWRNS